MGDRLPAAGGGPRARGSRDHGLARVRGTGSPGRDIEFPGDFRLLWADETEAVGVVRDELDMEHVLVLPLPPVAGPMDS